MTSWADMFCSLQLNNWRVASVPQNGPLEAKREKRETQREREATARDFLPENSLYYTLYYTSFLFILPPFPLPKNCT